MSSGNLWEEFRPVKPDNFPTWRSWTPIDYTWSDRLSGKETMCDCVSSKWKGSTAVPRGKCSFTLFFLHVKPQEDCREAGSSLQSYLSSVYRLRDSRNTFLSCSLLDSLKITLILVLGYLRRTVHPLRTTNTCSKFILAWIIVQKSPIVQNCHLLSHDW